MTDSLKLDGAEMKEFGPDPELTAALAALDPASDEPDYWPRFRTWVMTEAATELVRRRMMVEVTVEDLLASWSRAVLPVAMAAAVAAIALIRSPNVDAPAEAKTVGVEELLVVEVPEQTQPVLLSADAATGIVAFASDIY